MLFHQLNYKECIEIEWLLSQNFKKFKGYEYFSIVYYMELNEKDSMLCYLYI